MRVQSDKPVKAGGWIHTLDGFATLPPREEGERPKVNWNALQRCLAGAVFANGRIEALARQLGVTTYALNQLQVGYCVRRQAWTFPMRDVSGHIVGMRVRLADGAKKSVRGGSEGLFLPLQAGRMDPLVICEGPTDCAALVDYQIPAIGRPSCSGGLALIEQWVERYTPTRVVLLADNDGPGREGAERTKRALNVPTAIVTPRHHKDIRAALNAGVSRAAVLRSFETTCCA